MNIETIRLDKLIGSTVEYKLMDDSGEVEACITIPLKRNGIRYNPKNGRTSLTMSIHRKKTIGIYNETHFLSVVVSDKEILRKLKQSGYIQDLQFVGYIKNIRDKQSFNKIIDMSKDERDRILALDEILTNRKKQKDEQEE